MKHYGLRYLCRTSVAHERYKTVRVEGVSMVQLGMDERYGTVRVEVSTWYNWGCMRGIEQYMLRCLCGIIGGV